MWANRLLGELALLAPALPISYVTVQVINTRPDHRIIEENPDVLEIDAVTDAKKLTVCVATLPVDTKFLTVDA